MNTDQSELLRPEPPLESTTIVESLKSARPWVMFLAITGIVLGALLLLVGLTNIESGGVVWLFIAGACVILGPMLLRYGLAISELLHGGGVRELEGALDAQANFWRLGAPILVLLIIVFEGLVLLVFVLSPHY